LSKASKRKEFLMLKTLQRRVLVSVTAILVLVTGAVLTSANHSWNGYQWARTSNPFTLKVGDNVNSTWDPILNTTISDWSQSTVLDLTKVAGGANPRNCRPTSGRVEVCNSTYGNTGWLGVAQIWITGGTHITQGTVKLNDTYMNSAPYNTTPWRNLVSCQEVGHTLGLAHQDENFDNPNLGTCMDYTSDPSTNQHPNKHDYDELVLIYSHVDSTTTLGQLVQGMHDLAHRAPPEWGKLIRQSRNGHQEVYEYDFGDGHKVITFVTWE